MLLEKPTRNTKLIDNSNSNKSLIASRERKPVEAAGLILEKLLHPCLGMILF